MQDGPGRASDFGSRSPAGDAGSYPQGICAPKLQTGGTELSNVNEIKAASLTTPSSAPLNIYDTNTSPDAWSPQHQLATIRPNLLPERRLEFIHQTAAAGEVWGGFLSGNAKCTQTSDKKPKKHPAHQRSRPSSRRRCWHHTPCPLLPPGCNLLLILIRWTQTKTRSAYTLPPRGSSSVPEVSCFLMIQYYRNITVEISCFIFVSFSPDLSIISGITLYSHKARKSSNRYLQNSDFYFSCQVLSLSALFSAVTKLE